MYVSLITTEYINGRVAITTDRLGGFRTGHGTTPTTFWRQLLKWAGQKLPDEVVHVGVIKSTETYYENYLNSINGVTFRQIDTEYLKNFGPDEFDVIYFIGLPEDFPVDTPDVLEAFVVDGGGLIFESPDIDGEIELLSSIDSVIVSSVQRPTYDLAFWTNSGFNSDLYASNFSSSFMVTIGQEDVPENWDILMSNIETIVIPVDDEEILNQFDYDNTAVQEFGMAFVVGMKDGLVTLEEGESVLFSTSSSESSSSSSTLLETEWNVCDDILAYWKLNEDNANSFLWDSSGDFAQIGTLKSNGVDIDTLTRSVAGKVNNAISFSSGSMHNVVVPSGTKLNFTDGVIDESFSVVVWIKPGNLTGTKYILSKDGVWEIYTINGILYVKLINGANTRTIDSTASLGNGWNFVVVTYDTSDITIYLNNIDISGTQVDVGYSVMSDSNSEFYIGSSSLGDYFHGYLDNILIVDKVINSIEREGMWNMGRGTEECNAILAFTSSSESSSSSIDSSSSSSGGNSESSSSSFGFSSSSSTSSEGFSESSSSSEGNSESSSSENFSESSSSSSVGFSESSSSSEGFSESSSSSEGFSESSSSSENFSESSSSSKGFSESSSSSDSSENFSESSSSSSEGFSESSSSSEGFSESSSSSENFSESSSSSENFSESSSSSKGFSESSSSSEGFSESSSSSEGFSESSSSEKFSESSSSSEGFSESSSSSEGFSESSSSSEGFSESSSSSENFSESSSSSEGFSESSSSSELYSESSSSSEGESSSSSENDWHIELIDALGSDQTKGPTILTISNKPAVGYSVNDTPDFEIRFKRKSEETWDLTIAKDTGNAATSPHMAIINGSPAFAYSSSSDNIRYIRASNAQGTSWGTDLEANSDSPLLQSIKLIEISGRPAIIWGVVSSGGIKYLRADDSTGSSWTGTVHTIESGVSVSRTDIAIISGRPAIIYETSGSIKYIRADDSTGSAWGSPATIVSGSSPYLTTVSGRPAFAYISSGVKYLRSDDSTGSSWTGSTQTITSDNGQNPNLAIVAGNPAIVYKNSDMNTLEYARSLDVNGSSWGTIEVVDEIGSGTSFQTVNVQNNIPEIAYQKNVSGTFSTYYAKRSQFELFSSSSSSEDYSESSSSS